MAIYLGNTLLTGSGSSGGGGGSVPNFERFETTGATKWAVPTDLAESVRTNGSANMAYTLVGAGAANTSGVVGGVIERLHELTILDYDGINIDVQADGAINATTLTVAALPQSVVGGQFLHNNTVHTISAGDAGATSITFSPGLTAARTNSPLLQVHIDSASPMVSVKVGITSDVNSGFGLLEGNTTLSQSNSFSTSPTGSQPAGTTFVNGNLTLASNTIPDQTNANIGTFTVSIPTSIISTTFSGKGGLSYSGFSTNPTVIVDNSPGYTWDNGGREWPQGAEISWQINYNSNTHVSQARLTKTATGFNLTINTHSITGTQTVGAATISMTAGTFVPTLDYRTTVGAIDVDSDNFGLANNTANATVVPSSLGGSNHAVPNYSGYSSKSGSTNIAAAGSRPGNIGQRGEVVFYY